MSGVTSTGFVVSTIADIVTALNAAWRSVFGNAVNVDPQSRNGQEIGIIAEPIAEVWQAGESIAQLFNPNGAVAQGLDNLCALTGTIRDPASYSIVTLTLTGTPTTVVGSGKIASVPATAAKFATTAPATITAVSAWIPGTVTVGQRAYSDTPSRVYQVITAGLTDPALGPTGTGSNIVDGTAHWRYLGNGTGAIDAPALATVTGPVQGFSGTITNIDTAVSGWAGVINVLDAAPGANVELDAALRTKRVQELGGQGVSSLPALRSNILRVAGVTTCTIFENTTDGTVDGVTPHAFEALVEGGADADILAVIGNDRAAGIAPVGSTSGAVVDAAGVSRTEKFSRPTLVNLYVAVFVTKNPISYPSDGDTQIKEVIVAIGNEQPVGRDAEGTEISGWLFPRIDLAGVGVTGVLKMTSALLVDTAGTPVTSEVIMTARQRGVYDTSRITVTAIDGTP